MFTGKLALSMAGNERCVVISNLPASCDTVRLVDFSKQFGDIVGARLHRNGGGKGFVMYRDSHAADLAVNVSGTAKLDGQAVCLERCSSESAGFPGVAQDTEENVPAPLVNASLANSLASFTDTSGAVIVEGLPPSCDQEALCAALERYGAIERVSLSKGRNRALVRFHTSVSVQLVLDGAEGCTVDGKRVRVRALTEQTSGKKEGSSKQSSVLFVAGLPSTCDESHLLRAFSGFGAYDARMPVTVQEETQGFGFVSFQTPQAARAARTAVKSEAVTFEGLGVRDELVVTMCDGDHCFPSDIVSSNISFGDSVFVQGKSESSTRNARPSHLINQDRLSGSGVGPPVHAPSRASGGWTRWTHRRASGRNPLIRHAGHTPATSVSLLSVNSCETYVTAQRAAWRTHQILALANATFLVSHGVTLVLVGALRCVFPLLSWWDLLYPLWFGNGACLVLLVCSWFASCPYVSFCLQSRQTRIGLENPSLLTELLPEILLSMGTFLFVLSCTIAELLFCWALASNGRSFVHGGRAFMVPALLATCRGTLMANQTLVGVLGAAFLASSILLMCVDSTSLWLVPIPGVVAGGCVVCASALLLRTSLAVVELRRLVATKFLAQVMGLVALATLVILLREAPSEGVCEKGRGGICAATGVTGGACLCWCAVVRVRLAKFARKNSASNGVSSTVEDSSTNLFTNLSTV